MRNLPILLLLFVITSCSAPVEYEESWLDHPSVTDPWLSDPDLRVSTRPGLTAADRARPVIVAAHGFTASTYEWEEFREVAESRSDVLVSLVLLGGHGRSVEEFERSTWRDWGRPILEEYRALVAQGYTNISLAGSSAGATLILEQIAARAYDESPAEHFFFIDPIVVPGNKMLTMIGALGWIVGNSPNEDMTEEERPHWYTNRPAEALQQLSAITSRVRERLTAGFRLPAGSAAHVYKSTGDAVGDPVSALLIYKGLRDTAGRRIHVEMIDSDLHVFTRLQGRRPSVVGENDRLNQARVFEEMIAAATAAADQ